ncbi:hypothetical protein EB796_016032 [Bugula neritina]|uniref:Uncharacterized protein n=1 Tax=Bugula neritina TaxID=10212 RepID=A0A7J7JJH4_BUGNE|nr:hypothetical protein EB796_016032 [Bugula neritina]
MTSMAEAMEMAMVTNTVLATTMDMAVRTTAMIIMEVVTIRVVGMVVDMAPMVVVAAEATVTMSSIK